MSRSLALVSVLVASTLAACNRSPAPAASRDPKPVIVTSASAPSAPAANVPVAVTSAPSAAPAPKPTQVAAPKPADAPVRVKRLVLAKNVKDRAPVDAAETFSLDEVEKLYAFVELDNPERGASRVFVTFEKERGPSFGQVELSVGPSARWRTWAWTKGVKKPGVYFAVVKSADGRVLAKQRFEVTSQIRPVSTPW